MNVLQALHFNTPRCFFYISGNTRIFFKVVRLGGKWNLEQSYLKSKSYYKVFLIYCVLCVFVSTVEPASMRCNSSVSAIPLVEDVTQFLHSRQAAQWTSHNFFESVGESSSNVIFSHRTVEQSSYSNTI